jgi:hypothetical protein
VLLLAGALVWSWAWVPLLTLEDLELDAGGEDREKSGSVFSASKDSARLGLRRLIQEGVETARGLSRTPFVCVVGLHLGLLEGVLSKAIQLPLAVERGVFSRATGESGACSMGILASDELVRD